jgi:hypothetical protein
MTTKDISMKGKYILGDSGYVSKEWETIKP